MVRKWNTDGIEHVNGSYVYSEDYAALEKERDAAKAEIERLKNDNREIAARAVESQASEIRNCDVFDVEHAELGSYIAECLEENANKIRNGDIEL